MKQDCDPQITSKSSTKDYSQELRSLMQKVNISSFRELAQQTGISDWQIRQLRRGKAASMRLSILLSISKTLQVSLMDLVSLCSSIVATELQPTRSELNIGNEPELAVTTTDSSDSNLSPMDHTPLLHQEYERLQTQLSQQRQTLQQEFQHNSLQTLESWMLYWPTAIFAIEKNPKLPASRLVPLVRPVEKLLNEWGVKLMTPVGSEVAYDPKIHQLIKGDAQFGDPVQIRNPGYWHNGNVLHRARVEGKG